MRPPGLERHIMFTRPPKTQISPTPTGLILCDIAAVRLRPSGCIAASNRREALRDRSPARRHHCLSLVESYLNQKFTTRGQNLQRGILY